MKRIIERRQFLKNASCAALGTTTLWNTMLNLKTINAATAFNSSTAVNGGYKALVCVLLEGGSDSYNMLMPVETEQYNIYAATRSNLAVPNYNPNNPNNPNNIRPLGPTDDPANPPTHGVHPAMDKVQSLYNDGKLAFISNIGTLIEPVEKQNLYSGAYDLPLGLFSHIDQVSHWQTGIPQERISTGWGGKMSELLIAMNEQEIVPMNMSFNGSNLWQTGNSTVEYSLTAGQGSNSFNEFGGWTSMEEIRSMAINNVVDAEYQNIFKKTYNNTLKLSRDAHNIFSEAYDGSTDFGTTFNVSPYNGYDLAEVFETIAKTISVQSQLNMNRQVFFVSLGGWDHHDGLGDDYSGRVNLLDDSLHAFQMALEQLNMEDCVTTFTMSEFARTLSSNGNGSDHAWGGNMMVMGGAVNGGEIYGTYPTLELDGELEIGGGVLIPTLSADEYFAEIAKWFGVMNSDLTMLFPNLGTFYDPMSNEAPIGFLNL